MSYQRLCEALGIEWDGNEHCEISSHNENEGKYRPWGGGGAGNKNGHYGCRHSDESKRIMSEKKKGKVPWNKNMTGYLVHSKESKRAMSEKLSGSLNAKAILDETKVETIIRRYYSKPEIDNVGTVQGNGKKMSYLWAFSIQISEEYGTTPAAIKRLLQKKSWKHVWQKLSISDKD